MFGRSPPWDEVTYWALDLETGGLDPRRDSILAVGMVPIRGGTLRLGEAYSALVAPEDASAISEESIRAHHLVPSEVRNAPPLAVVAREICLRLQGAVLLVHHAALDVPFLVRGCARAGARWPRPKVVDTVTLLNRLAHRRHRLAPDALGVESTSNLTRARASLGLPAYGAHDALTDAIAAAELFLLLRAHLGLATLKQVL